MSLFDPVFVEAFSTLYLSEPGKDTGIPFSEESAKVAGQVLLKGKTVNGKEKVFAVRRDQLIKWAEENDCKVLEEGNICRLINQVKQEIESTIFKPKSQEEVIRILRFNPRSLEMRKKLFKCIDLDLDGTLRHYPLETKEGRWARIEVAKIVSALGGRRISLDIKQFGFDPRTDEGKNALLEIAKIAAAHDGIGTSEYIQNYGFDPKTDEGHQALLEIGKIAAEHGTAKYIQNYGFDPKTDKGQRALLEIAAIDGEENGSSVVEDIQNYRLDPKKGHHVLLKIAKRSAIHKGLDTSIHIKNFGFDPKTDEGRNALLEVAKIAAANDGRAVSVHIQHYGFNPNTDEGLKALLEVAEIALSQNNRHTLEYIQNYGFNPKTDKGRDALFKVALIAAAQEESWISRHIENFGFDPMTNEGRKALLEIAMIAASKEKTETAKYIRNYGFQKAEEGQQALLEVAKYVAKRNGWEITVYIRNYGFNPKKEEGQKALFEVAKLAAAKNGRAVSVHIENYSFDPETDWGKEALFKIALIAAAQNGGGVSEHIRCYHFGSRSYWGKKALLEVAKVAAAQDGVKTSEYIHNYDFDPKTEEGQQALSAVLLIASRGNLFEDPTNVECYPVEDLKVLEEALRNIFKRKFEAEHQLPSKYWLGQLFEGFPKIFEGFISGDEFVKGYLEDINQEGGAWFDECYSRAKEPWNQERLVDWIFLLVVFQTAYPNINLFFGSRSFWLFEEIEKRDPELRNQLTKELFLTVFEGRLATLKNTLGDETKERPLRLVRLVLRNYPIEAKTDCEKAIQSFNQPKARIALKDGAKQKLILETLLLIRVSSLPPQIKGEYVAWLAALPKKLQQQAASLIKDILLFGGAEDLKVRYELDALKSILEKRFREACGVNIEQFSEKYAKTIGQWRKKEALITYAAGLKKLEDNGVASGLFGNFLSYVLENTFEEKRSNIDQNPHLKAIAETHPKIFAKWQESISLSTLEMEVSDSTSSATVRILNQLKMAVQNGHLGGDEEKYPHFVRAMRGEITIDDALKQIELQEARFQEKALLQIASEEFDIEQKEKLLKTLSLELENDVFKEDLLACINLLKEGMERKSLQVVDSADPNHFLLMGTEVQGSCQKVNGSPSNNRGLLGYMLDGKHRLLLVLDEYGSIVARSVARLLVDEKDNPVLFEERLYVADSNPKYASLIRKLALKKAAEMQVPLAVCHDHEKDKEFKRYPSSLKALKGPVPFEYVDALSGMQNIPYEIPMTFVVPPEPR